MLTGPTLSPLGQLVTRVLTPRLPFAPKYVPGPPKRFAQGIGADAVGRGAGPAFGFGETRAAYVLVAMIVVAATLESVFAVLPRLQDLRGPDARRRHPGVGLRGVQRHLGPRSATAGIVRSAPASDRAVETARVTAPVVTISAPYGTGGPIIGRMVAERFDVPFLDRAIPVAVAQTLAVSIDDAEAHDEHAANPRRPDARGVGGGRHRFADSYPGRSCARLRDRRHR